MRDMNDQIITYQECDKRFIIPSIQREFVLHHQNLRKRRDGWGKNGLDGMKKV